MKNRNQAGIVGSTKGGAKQIPIVFLSEEDVADFQSVYNSVMEDAEELFRTMAAFLEKHNRGKCFSEWEVSSATALMLNNASGLRTFADALAKRRQAKPGNRIISSDPANPMN